MYPLAFGTGLAVFPVGKFTFFQLGPTEGTEPVVIFGSQVGVPGPIEGSKKRGDEGIGGLSRNKIDNIATSLLSTPLEA